jgi:DUF438 domain-containing protein
MNYESQEFLSILLDNMKEVVVFADTNHIIQYMNASAIERYKKYGGKALIGQSLLNCHKPQSNKVIEAVLNQMQNEGLIAKKTHESEDMTLFMRAVKDKKGKLLGYYEQQIRKNTQE